MTEITSRLSTALADCYQIERHLGEGGRATVYLAEDLKHRRKVALEVLKPELAAVLGARGQLRGDTVGGVVTFRPRFCAPGPCAALVGTWGAGRVSR